MYEVNLPLNTYMEILTWIDKDLVEIKGTLLFGKYFDSILPEASIDVTHIFNPTCGINMVLSLDNSVTAIHFFSGKDGLTNQFIDILPFDLKFSNTNKETRLLFGEPDQCGGGEKSILYSKTKNWDKYFFEDFSLHLQFSDIDCSIDLITIISTKGR